LVEKGYDVVNVSRSGQPSKYLEHPAWKKVHQVLMDREAETKAGTFGDSIATLRPDILIDIRSFSLDDVKPLVEALNGKIEHMLITGTDWIHGRSQFSACTEEQARNSEEFGPYGYGKHLMSLYLLEQYRKTGLPVTILHPGHLTMKNHLITNPQGNQNHELFAQIKRGEEITLPNMGNEFLHHVHISDVALAYIAAIETGAPSYGQEFHTVSPQAITMRFYAEGVFKWFGREPRIKYLPLDQWMATQENEIHAKRTEDHVLHSLSCSIEKAKRILHWEPNYTSLEALHEVVIDWLDKDSLI
jgi:nucleoside-diphosphate-sugar epimerase